MTVSTQKTVIKIEDTCSMLEEERRGIRLILVLANTPSCSNMLDMKFKPCLVHTEWDRMIRLETQFGERLNETESRTETSCLYCLHSLLLLLLINNTDFQQGLTHPHTHIYQYTDVCLTYMLTGATNVDQFTFENCRHSINCSISNCGSVHLHQTGQMGSLQFVCRVDNIVLVPSAWT